MTVEAPDHGSGGAAQAAELPIAAARAAARFSKSLEVALAELNLSLPQYRLLVFLTANPERASALARRLDVSPPSLTALVDGCVARGLVERATSPEDRRRVVHVITPEGDELLARADAIASARLVEVAGHLTSSQSRKILEGLELLGRALDQARVRRNETPADEAR